MESTFVIIKSSIYNLGVFLAITPISGKIDLKNVIRANRQYDEEEYS